MEITVGVFLLLFGMAFVAEFIDSSLGMGYGTLLAPLLIVMGFDPLIAVPAVLLSQASGGFIAAVFHHQFKNASFTSGSKDLKIVFLVSSFGVFATMFAACVALSIPKLYLKLYIGLVVLAMGCVLIVNRKFNFSWKKMIGVAVLSAFNKGMSGGGFGPVLTAGQIMSGQDHKGAIAATTLSEAPICTVGFLTYVIGKAIKEFEGPILDVPFSEFLPMLFSEKVFQWELLMALLLGSVFVAPFGAFATKLMRTRRLMFVLGILICVLGIWTLSQTVFLR